MALPKTLTNKISLAARPNSELVQLYRIVLGRFARHRMTSNGEEFPLTPLYKRILAELEHRNITVIN